VALNTHSHHAPRLTLGAELSVLPFVPPRHVIRRYFTYSVSERFINYKPCNKQPLFPYTEITSGFSNRKIRFFCEVNT
jgi:hypothetical protein